jgi:hypothetical protein
LRPERTVIWIFGIREAAELEELAEGVDAAGSSVSPGWTPLRASAAAMSGKRMVRASLVAAFSN